MSFPGRGADSSALARVSPLAGVSPLGVAGSRAGGVALARGASGEGTGSSVTFAGSAFAEPDLAELPFVAPWLAPPLAEVALAVAPPAVRPGAAAEPDAPLAGVADAVLGPPEPPGTTST